MFGDKRTTDNHHWVIDTACSSKTIPKCCAVRIGVKYLGKVRENVMHNVAVKQLQLLTAEFTEGIVVQLLIFKKTHGSQCSASGYLNRSMVVYAVHLVRQKQIHTTS